MKVSTILDQIDSGFIALPEFQRGYVWTRKQVRDLFESCYRRRPVGGLLVWPTASGTATRRSGGPIPVGNVKLLLDGQQRMTSLYGVMRGEPPKFFDGDRQAFTGLQFHLGTEEFAFHQPIKMRDDPLWIDVTELMKEGNNGIGPLVTRLSAEPKHAPHVGRFVSSVNRLLGIANIDLHVEEIDETALRIEEEAGQDKIDIVVDIFNRVNSGGTRLSKGDLALARLCAEWPQARDAMNAKLKEWTDAGYDFKLDWLLRSINTVLTGEAKFSHLHDKAAHDIQDGLERASKHIDHLLNLIGGCLGLDHDRVLFGRFGIPVMVRYMDWKNGALDARERDKLLFWFAQAGMWGRFSGSTEAAIDQDLATLEDPDGGLDALIDRLRLERGGLKVEPDHFTVSSIGARFYPVLYMLTRMGEARDWGAGLPLKANMLGKMNKLEVHHIFPKARLYDSRRTRAEVNALANFCFQTKGTNLDIRDRLPEEYFPEVQAKHPGALASQWIPMDPELWKIERYPDFLAARRELLTIEANKRFEELLRDDARWLTGTAHAPTAQEHSPVGGVADEDEERELEELNEWVEERGLPRGQVAFDHVDPETGARTAVFDLAWKNGLQPGLTQPVAVLLNEPAEVLPLASAAGFRCFTSPADFRAYVEREILEPEAA